jgi:putative chitinase
MIPNEVQAALVALGYSVAVDGVIGPKTKAAIREFQGRHELKVDGVAGPLTIAKLHEVLARETVDDRPGILTPAIIRAVAPKAREDIVEVLVEAVAPFAAVGIVTKLRSAHFLTQIATETGGLTVLEESLNYSVDGLLKTFSRKRITKAQALALGRKPGRAADQEAIANILYGGAWGAANLGNTEPGDGWRYRGGGLMQTTGRANYRRAGFEANPEALRTPAGGLKAALTFWSNNDLNRIADRDDIVALRKAVNGGANGLDEAKGYLAKAKKALGI